MYSSSPQHLVDAPGCEEVGPDLLGGWLSDIFSEQTTDPQIVATLSKFLLTNFSGIRIT